LRSILSAWETFHYSSLRFAIPPPHLNTQYSIRNAARALYALPPGAKSHPPLPEHRIDHPASGCLHEVEAIQYRASRTPKAERPAPPRNAVVTWDKPHLHATDLHRQRARSTLSTGAFQ